MNEIEKQLQSARRALLDLTMNNRLLNFRPTKLRTIKIVASAPEDIYSLLVIDNKSLSLRPSLKLSESSTKNSNRLRLFEETESSEKENDNEESNLWKSSGIEDNSEERNSENYLQTNIDSENLQKRLFYISQEAHSILEELGYSTLYVASGFLEWFETDEST